ncbi:MAG: TraM recognition domain-containing protein [Bdellovibrionales bacterium]|nr:TraM recognition domain-containing protein [Bdellovibrionales bacterium]
MHDKKPHEDSSTALVLSVVFAGFVFFQKLYPALQVWMKPVQHQLSVFGLALIGLCILLFRAFDQLAEGFIARSRENAILGNDKDAVFCGETLAGEPVFIKPGQRAMHAQVIGTTNAGKTESVILPWAIQDIQQGRGLILIDGKADRSLLEKLYAYVVKAGREKDFRLFSIGNVEESHQFNPLIGGTPEEIAERVFNSFEFENPYYRSVQFEIFSQVLRVFRAANIVPTFRRLHDGISDPDKLSNALRGKSPDLECWLDEFIKLDRQERLKRTSGLTAALSHFAFGKVSALYNTETPGIDLDLALKSGQIMYFQLPVLLAPFLGKATGKLALQALQSAVANRHRSGKKPKFYSIFLDDFTEYLYPGFVSILNKTRSAHIGVVFAHQALGDIKTLGEPIANSILTNSNLKIFMRGSDPESAEYFSRVIGTKEAMKFTERTKRGVIGRDFTGDESARAVEEFIVHPNRFKSSLGVGEAVIVVPHARGSKCVHMKFQRFDDLEMSPMATVLKIESPGLAKVDIKTTEGKNNAEFTDSHPNSIAASVRLRDSE